MRALVRLAVAASTIGGLAVPLTLVPAGVARAQGQQGDEAQPRQISLTQKQIDSALVAQKEMQAVEAKLPQGGQPDPKAEAKLDAIAKKNGFSGLAEYSDVSSSIGIVMAGIDPQTKTYIGPQAVLKKQIAEVKADQSMPPKEKKEALEELNAALGPSQSAQPPAGNIQLVIKNFDALSQGMQQSAD